MAGDDADGASVRSAAFANKAVNPIKQATGQRVWGALVMLNYSMDSLTRKERLSQCVSTAELQGLLVILGPVDIKIQARILQLARCHAFVLEEFLEISG